jgi:hypothetical protein
MRLLVEPCCSALKPEAIAYYKTGKILGEPYRPAVGVLVHGCLSAGLP